MTLPSLSGIDHCHLNVVNLTDAVVWYKAVLGFHVVPELAFWDEGKGPLTLQDSAASVRLALFEREGTSKGVAFGATGEQFIAWLKHFADLGVKTVVADHKVTYSVYFQDLSGNSHEITSHDYLYIAAHI
ncbi:MULTISPECIES: VOC family protein [unclassified Pseudoalteromonas]|uniref:VOC family protein n=1 Tax=unclassified Pseudoalteromonas TaxID=194690 RepID=UPI001108E230|nr:MULTISPECIES: VOC family protein [unclassified Pseudoalteromonas]TMN71906.1 hypothetical protein CWB85_09080 [Pseudoalteromonas sp. S1727]BDF94885.1 hypothetical protein KAN5_17230 [Pseudoalteromonas sp. KAN5]